MHNLPPSRASGQAATEFLVVAGVFCVCLLSMPYLAKFFEVKTATLEAARHAAWARTVWRIEEDSDTEPGAVTKTDDALAQAVRFHFFSAGKVRNEAADSGTSTDTASATGSSGTYTRIPEWEDARTGTRAVEDPDRDVTVTTTDDDAPGWVNTNIVSNIFDAFSSAYGALTNATGAGYNFDVDFKGLHTAEVKTTLSSDFVEGLWKIVAPDDTAPTLTMDGHVTILGGEWNGGGNQRTKKKALGLVVTSFEDATVVKNIREATKKVDNVINTVFGTGNKYFETGFDPTKFADEAIPDDRKEETDENQDTDSSKKKVKDYEFVPPPAYYVEYPFSTCLSAGVPDPYSEICALN